MLHVVFSLSLLNLLIPHERLGVFISFLAHSHYPSRSESHGGPPHYNRELLNIPSSLAECLQSLDNPGR